MRDGSHGAALLAVVHYYCPEQMKLDGECGLRLSRGPGGLEGVQIASVDDEAGRGSPEYLAPAGVARGCVDLATDAWAWPALYLVGGVWDIYGSVFPVSDWTDVSGDG